MISWGKKIISGGLLVMIGLAASWALLRPGFFRVHDYVHAARVAEMLTALTEGHFPVRWVKNLGFGYGMPLYEFYAPLPYYIGAIFYWLGLDIILTLKLLFLLPTWGILWGGYRVGKELFGRLGGVVVAAAVTLAPYRAVNLFVRGAISEAWGMMALPWILWGVVLVVRNKKNGWYILVLSLITLMLSHNLTTMMFVPVSGLFGLGLWLLEGYLNNNSQLLVRLFNQSRIKSLFRLASAYLIAIGCSAFYLFPAVSENSYTKINSILSGYFHYSHHFLYLRQFINPAWGYGGSEWGPNDGISFFMGWGQIAGFMIISWLSLKLMLQLRKQTKSDLTVTVWRLGVALFCLLFLGASLYLSLLKSKFIWDQVPLLVYIQFPWRFLSVGMVFLALLNGLAVTLIKPTTKRYIVATVLVVMTLINARYFQPESYLDHAADFYYTDPQLIQKQMSSILPDYIPVQMSDQLTPPQNVATVHTDEQSRLEVLVDRGHEKLVKTWFKTEQELVFSVADFPGWQAYLDAQPVPHQTDAAGRISVFVPVNPNQVHTEHQVGLRFNSTPIRRYSDFMSLLSWLGLAGIYLVSHRDLIEAMPSQTTHDRKKN